MSNVWATMPCVQLSHNMLVNCIDNRQNQLFSVMSLRDVMELPLTFFTIRPAPPGKISWRFIGVSGHNIANVEVDFYMLHSVIYF